MKRRSVQSIESRLRYIGVEMRNKLELIQKLENELDFLKSEMNNIQVSD